MDIGSAITFLQTLSQSEKTHVLARLCHDLTAIARDTYGDGRGVQFPERLRAFNEIQHRMTGFLTSLLDGDINCCPDESIATIFFGQREDMHIVKLLAFVFERVCQTVSHCPSPLAFDNRHNGQ
jgi:hypothetical protein